MKPVVGLIKAQPQRLGTEDLVETTDVVKDLVVIVRAKVEALSLAAWIAAHRPWVIERSLRYGAILFRGFDVTGHDSFRAAVVDGAGFQLIDYKYRSTPRRDVADRIYTATLYPASESIPLHNEMSYTLSWPSHILFYSQRAAEHGGESTLADSRKVYAALSATLRKKFESKGVLYVRNYGLLDLPWSDVFGTTSKQQVEEHCREMEIEVQWRDGDAIRTRQRCQAMIHHPRTDEPVWFNQAHLFHYSALAEEVRRELLSSYEPDELPRNASYGDGKPLEHAALEEIRGAYAQHTVTIGLKKGDVLMLDNVLAAHGRLGYSGERQLYAALATAPGEV